MSNAVKGVSAPVAQCVSLRSSNQTLTGSNLAAYSIFNFFFFFWYYNKFLFFLRSFLFFLFMESI